MDHPKPTARNGVFSLADQVVVSGSRFLITVLIAKACGADVLGIYALVTSLVLMALMVQQTLVTTPYSNFRNRVDRDAEPEYYCDAWFLSLATSLAATLLILVTGAAFWLAADHLRSTGSQSTNLTQLAVCCWSAALAMPFMMAAEFFRRTWLIRMQAFRALILDAMIYSAVIGTIAVLFFSDRLNANLVFFSLAVANSLAAIVAFGLLIPKNDFALHRVKRTWRKHWGFGKWIVGSEALTFGRANLLKWIIGGFLGIGAAGIYAACESLMRAVNPFFLGVASVAEPTLAAGYARTGKREVKRIAFKVLLIMILGTLPICLGVALASRYLLLLFYGETFADYGSVVVWLASSSFVFSISYPFANSIQAIDRPDINFRIRIVAFVGVVVAALFVTPYWGLAGVAAVHCIGTVISFGLRLYFFSRLVALDDTQVAPAALGPAP